MPAWTALPSTYSSRPRQVFPRIVAVLHVDLFSWLWTGLGGESDIGSMIQADFEMYLHHQREINGKPNRGWLRTKLYSLTQQR